MLHATCRAVGDVVVVLPVAVRRELAVALGWADIGASDTDVKTGDLIIGNGRAIGFHDVPLKILLEIGKNIVALKRWNGALGELLNE